MAASDQNDERCFFSNYGSLIDVAAPGGGYERESNAYTNILSTMPDLARSSNSVSRYSVASS